MLEIYHRKFQTDDENLEFAWGNLQLAMISHNYYQQYKPVTQAFSNIKFYQTTMYTTFDKK